MTAIVWIVVLISFAASIGVVYLVASDVWRDRTPGDRITNVTRDAQDAAGRLAAMYQQALRDMRRR